MKNHLSLIMAVTSLGFASCANEYPLKHLDVVVQVLEEFGQPVSNAMVTVAFTQTPDYIQPNPPKVGLTDAHGFFACGDEMYVSMMVTVEKKGYYRSNTGSMYFSHKVDGTIHPYDPSKQPIKIVLRKMGEPIPMFVRKIDTLIPEAGKDYEFDLLAGDWVEPMGNGKIPDVVFRSDGYWNGPFDNRAVLTAVFPSPHDGMIRFEPDPLVLFSDFLTQRIAPDSGYVSEHRWRKERYPHKASAKIGDPETIVDDRKDTEQAVFRIRTQVDGSGKVLSAIYGKIAGGIHFGGASEQGTYLKIPACYINPDGGRNLEFNPDANLVPNNPRNAQRFAP